MEYHYFTIEDIEMLTFNGIPHLHNHLNYLIHTDKDQKFTNEDSVRNVSFIFDNEGNSKALRWTDDLEKRIELKKYVFRYIRDLYKRLFYARVECPRRDVHNWNKEMVAEMFVIIGKENYYSIRGEYTKPYDTSKRKAEKITRVLTIQSSDLDVSKKVYADKDRCNYQEALPIYRRLFDDYNRMKETDYSSFFWGFSKLKTKDMDKAIERACHMIGKETDDSKIYVLDIPSELCLETDFYNFADEIYAYQYPNEMESIWNSIYEKRNSERQVIFPYIEPSMIVGEIKQGKFIEFNHEEQNLELDEIEK